MTEELQTAQQSSPQSQSPQQPQQSQQQKPRLGPNDYRNSEFVTKLMAANPPYMYSPAIGPHNFFFSEMLRSLVANKRNESLRNAEQLHQQQQAQAQAHSQSLALHSRRPRKRSWSQHRIFPETLKDSKEPEEKISGQPEKPLELTNKLSAFTRNITSKYEDNSETKSANEKPPINNNNLISDPPAGSMPPSDLILPPPPPVWYPPLYPPYGIDPLHFFIDLRVSGHIYDRKKELASPSSDGSATVKNEHSKLIPAGPDRQGSAFSVPKPREGLKPSSAVNLSTPPPQPGRDDQEENSSPNQQQSSPPLLFANDFKENKYDIIKNTNYVMQNLPRIYGDLNHNTHLMPNTQQQQQQHNQNQQLESVEDESNLSDGADDCKSITSNDEYDGVEGKFRSDSDLNVISDEDESIAVDEN
ncbi:uncharacterized protein LOC129757713 [Uranotaenia lowii]|uniref:uncharacterized protein LOC129757713 n=1 Tax=Uranotaenia lowii TaxID=190385 RepID=UPI00247AA95D|nr:uncharacterized protein LOC129757713 [Uranotaenia lowii]